MKINDSKIIAEFEQAVAKYAGSLYGVAVSSCTNGIFLCLELLKNKGILKPGDTIAIPKHTYMSVPMSILHAGLQVAWLHRKWKGCYELSPTRIYDAATRFTKGMYIKNSLYVVSFQYKKHLAIGRGGMILLDNYEDAKQLKLMRFNGRSERVPQKLDYYTVKGWNMYMLPEQAARGLTLLTLLKDKNPDIGGSDNYPDVSKQWGIP